MTDYGFGYVVMDLDGRVFAVPREVEAGGGSAVQRWLVDQGANMAAPDGPVAAEGTGRGKRGRG